MAVRGQEGVGVLDHQEAGRPVDAHPLAAPRWGARITVAPCPATAVSMAVVPPMPSLDLTVAGIANDARHGMEAGSSREVVIDPTIDLLSALVIDPTIDLVSALVIDPTIGLVSALVIDPVIGLLSGLGIVSVIEPVIEPENALVIARKSGSATVPVPSTEIRTLPVRALKTNAQGLDVFAIATIGTATAVAPGMSGANRPSAPDLALTRLVLSGRMQHRRLQRPLRQRTI